MQEWIEILWLKLRSARRFLIPAALSAARVCFLPRLWARRSARIASMFCLMYSRTPLTIAQRTRLACTEKGGQKTAWMDSCGEADLPRAGDDRVLPVGEGGPLVAPEGVEEQLALHVQVLLVADVHLEGQLPAREVVADPPGAAVVVHEVVQQAQGDRAGVLLEGDQGIEVGPVRVEGPQAVEQGLAGRQDLDHGRSIDEQVSLWGGRPEMWRAPTQVPLTFSPPDVRRGAGA